MAEIPDITSVDISIGDIEIPRIIPYDGFTLQPVMPPPVVVNIGAPVVDIPGCVEAHTTKNPKNNQVTSDDPKGTVTYCDAGVPSFSPIDYNPEEMTITTSTPPPKVNPPETPEVPKTPEVPNTCLLYTSPSPRDS